MKPTVKDKIEGTFLELEEKTREITGKLSGDPELESEGTGEKISGKMQGKIGQFKKILGK